MPIQFHKLYEDAILPRRATKGSAGYDLYFYGKESDLITVKPGESVTLPTGVSLELPVNDAHERKRLYGQVVPRSGWAAKFGITVTNAPGTIDQDYYPREIHVLLINHGEEIFTVAKGDRVAQLIIGEYLITDDDAPISEERSGGFGSTGSKG